MIKKAIGVLGGTFDPVHFGHLRLAKCARDDFQLDEVHLLPCRVPALKPQPIATAQQRVDMLRLAIANEPGLVVDESELHRDGPSYTVDTLRALRVEVGPECAICLIMGMDAFLSLPAWHEWQEIIGLAHVIVMQRPGYEVSTKGEMADYYSE